MRFCKWYLFALTATISSYTFTSKAQEIKIGQLCPDVPLKNIINHPVTDANLSDFKGKLLILDFWGTGCAACIRAFPKLDSLQKKFKDKLQIVAINSESQDSTKRFFQRMKHIKKPAIPFVTGDTILSRLFPHIYVPHHVWIDSTGIVRYITDGHNATAEHLEQFINGTKLELAEKKYEESYFFESPLMALTSKVGVENLESYSLLMHCLSGVTFPNAAISTTGSEKPNRITQTCASIIQLYITAFSEGGNYNFSAKNTIVLDVNDDSKYKHPENYNDWDAWISKNSYNYELMVPPSQSNQLYKIMQMDLLRYFKVKGTIEKRTIKCLSLVRTQQIGKIKSKGGNPATNFWVMTTDSILYMKNQPFERFVTALTASAKAQGLGVPFIDETNYYGNIDIQISKETIDSFDINKLKIELGRFGIDLIETKRVMNVLVLREKKN